MFPTLTFTDDKQSEFSRSMGFVLVTLMFTVISIEPGCAGEIL